MLDQAFEALKTYDWGVDMKVLAPIDEAIVATQKDAAGRKDLETKLAAVLKSGASRDAKDYVCRKLQIVGTNASVPTLAELLPNKDLSHMARLSLEANPSAEAGAALRDALGKVTGAQKIGVVSSLGARKDTAAISALAALLGGTDGALARAAAISLGSIGGADAAKALADAKVTAAEAKSSVVDAQLKCAESLLAAGKKAEALAIYKKFVGDDQPKHVKLAGTRGMLAVAGKKE